MRISTSTGGIANKLGLRNAIQTIKDAGFDCVDISTENDSFYCYPTKENVVTKLAFATEIIYQKAKQKNK